MLIGKLLQVVYDPVCREGPPVFGKFYKEKAPDKSGAKSDFWYKKQNLNLNLREIEQGNCPLPLDLMSFLMCPFDLYKISTNSNS
jgi:hypothetical protein